MSERTTTHDDLMDLGSRWAYDPALAVGSTVSVNGVAFLVEKITTDVVTGLDAFVFKNSVSGEITVGFQGTVDDKDVIADALLVTSLTPSQYAAAELYVQDMAEEYGSVHSVCGNSLGGGLAAYVAARNPDVTAVTVNPAPVPEAYANVDAPNVHNYVASTDILNRMLRAADLEGGVIGNTVKYPGTSFYQGHIAANHVGSDGAEGVYDASMAVSFSIFHGDVVLSGSGFGAKVDIDAVALEQLSRSLEIQRADLHDVVTGEVDELQRVLERHARAMPAREAAARAEYIDETERDYDSAKELIGRLVDNFEATFRSPLVSLPPVPAPLKLAWTPLREQITEATGELGSAVDALACLVIRDVAADVWDACYAPMFGESESIARRLAAQCGAIDEDSKLIEAKWAVLNSSAARVAGEVTRMDAAIAAAVASGRCPPDAVPVRIEACPAGFVQPLQGDVALRFRQAIAETRQTAVGELIVQLATRLSVVTRPLEVACVTIGRATDAVEFALNNAVTAVKTAIWAWQRTPVGFVAEVGGLGDGIREFSGALEDVRAKVVDQLNVVGEIAVGVERALEALPDAVEAMRPYLYESFFSDSVIEDAYEALSKVRNLSARSSMTFGEVEFQLAGHEARAIDALADNARDVRRDLSTMNSSLSKMIA